MKQALWGPGQVTAQGWDSQEKNRLNSSFLPENRIPVIHKVVQESTGLSEHKNHSLVLKMEIKIQTC